MASNDDISVNLLNLDRGEPRAVKHQRWFIFNRSPLARKIILFNLIALGILVSGVLYLNQAKETQVALRSDTLSRQAELMSAALASHSDNPAYQDLTSATFTAFFDSLVDHSNSIVQVYDSSGQVAHMFVTPVSPKLTDESDSDAVTNLLQRLWAVISNPYGDVEPWKRDVNLQEHFTILALTAISSNERTKNAELSVGGEIYIAVAVPISGADGVNGAILISSRRGEVDSLIRSTREQILQIFLLATLSSIILSIVLANSIARPLRRLSAAAQNAHDDAGGKINIARVNIPDLTARPDEIGDLSRSMRNMTDALLDRIDENKTFAADVAHEIKNPLTSMRSAVETLEYVKDDESRIALLQVIQNDVERLDRLVTDISNASRLEGELVRGTWEDVDICALLNAMVENFNTRGERQDVNLGLSIKTNERWINGLTGRLEQVFTNLISNALSFVPQNGHVHILVKETVKGFLRIEISDDGPGIPEENLDDVFSRFYTERPASQFGEHSGLGLAISKQIVEAHGGIITAQNGESGGALFVVELPL